MVTIFMLVFCGIATALYLQFTPVGSDVVLGVQSRYFIPVILLPLTPLLLAAPCTQLRPRIDQGSETARTLPNLNVVAAGTIALMSVAAVALTAVGTLV